MVIVAYLSREDYLKRQKERQTSLYILSQKLKDKNLNNDSNKRCVFTVTQVEQIFAYIKSLQTRVVARNRGF